MLFRSQELGRHAADFHRRETPIASDAVVLVHDGCAGAQVGQLLNDPGWVAVAAAAPAFLLRALSEPDYDLSVAADRFTLTPGQPLAVPVKVTRVRGFAKPVEVVAQGLPAGVKFEIAAPAKPDPNTVTVSLTSEIGRAHV